MANKIIKIIKAASFTTFFFSLLGGLYIVGNAWFHPETLPWQLSRHIKWIAEDTFAILSFSVSFISFFIWNLIREIENK